MMSVKVEVAAQYGLTEEELDHACRWAKASKDMREIRRAFDQKRREPAKFVPTKAGPKTIKALAAVAEAKIECKQCDRMVTIREGQACQKKFCKGKS